MGIPIAGKARLIQRLPYKEILTAEKGVVHYFNACIHKGLVQIIANEFRLKLKTKQGAQNAHVWGNFISKFN